MTKHNQDESVTVHVGDCRHILASLPDQSVNCCVTSPPYWGLRDYGHADQIGMEKTPEEYVAKMVEVFREVRRVLRDDGTLWLNLGDSYSRNPTKGGSGPGGKNESRWGYGAAQSSKAGSSDGKTGRGDRPGTRAGGIGPKQLLGIPWRVAFALQADGWYLRQDVIWSKPNPMPESVRDRCTKSHEYVFLMSKSERYYYDSDAINEPSTSKKPAGNKRHKYTDAYNAGASDEHRTKAGLVALAGVEWESRNKRSVWTISTRRYAGAHFATMPPELAETCVLAGCPEGGTVLDPFGGSGTTAGVAKKHWRKAIICELNEDYTKLIPDRVDSIAGSAPLFDGREDTMSLFSDQE